MIGRKVDGQGQIWSDSGKVIGKAELVEGADNKPDGPFADFENNSIAKDGTIKSADGSIIGRVIEGDIKKLVGKKVDVSTPCPISCSTSDSEYNNNSVVR